MTTIASIKVLAVIEEQARQIRALRRSIFDNICHLDDFDAPKAKIIGSAFLGDEAFMPKDSDLRKFEELVKAVAEKAEQE